MDKLDEVLTESQNRGFIGPGSFLFHVEHARGLAKLIPPHARSVLDLGSGGGLPGLVISHEDDRTWVLLDSMAKRGLILKSDNERNNPKWFAKV